jgi:asparagine synthetase B (glutamine-hydrolysing)
LLARDRLGQKPLVYRLANGRIVFASELKALLQLPNAPREVSPLAVALYLAYQYVPHPHSILQGAMLGYWSNFARRGDPNDAELEDWPAFDPAAPRVLELGDRIAPLAAPDASLCEELAPSLYPGWRSN